MLRITELKLPLSALPVDARRAADAPSETDEDRRPVAQPVAALTRMAAQALGVKIYTIGLGNREIVQQRGLPPGYLPDEETLQKIADMTGGKYYRADNAEKFEKIYAEIDKLEKTEAVINKYTEYRELFAWFVAGGLALLLIEIVLGQTAFRRLP